MSLWMKARGKMPPRGCHCPRRLRMSILTKLPRQAVLTTLVVRDLYLRPSVDSLPSCQVPPAAMPLIRGAFYTRKGILSDGSNHGSLAA